MAERKNTQRNEKQPEDAIAMLQADHKKVKALFDKFESAGDGQTKVKQQIAEEVFMELEIHARLEEEIFGTFQIPVDSLLPHTQGYTRFRQTNCSLLLPLFERCQIFYPAFDAAADTEGEELVAESIEEHQVVKTLIEEMRELDPSDKRYEAKFTVLMENVRHHIEEEEEEMFPEAKDILEDEMDELAEQMQELKQELMAS